MIDDALLRPGRLEVQVEIGLPKVQGRVDILNIHTNTMRYGCHIGSQCCGSGMFITDPTFFHSRSRIRIFYPGSASKNLSILTQKNRFLSSRKYDPGFRPGSLIRILIFLPIPDPAEVKKAPDPGSGSATLSGAIASCICVPCLLEMGCLKLGLRIRMIFGSCIRIRVRVISWIRIRIIVKIQELYRLKAEPWGGALTLTMEAWRLNNEPSGRRFASL
jgi:hypothetical protein